MDWKKRIKNVPTILAVVALIFDMLIFNGVVSLPVSETWEGFIQRALEVMVVLGVLNNPTTPGLGDGKKDEQG